MPKSPKVDVERLRFKRGDSVILSGTHPLKDRVGEGQAAASQLLLHGENGKPEVQIDQQVKSFGEMRGEGS